MTRIATATLAAALVSSVSVVLPASALADGTSGGTAAPDGSSGATGASAPTSGSAGEGGLRAGAGALAGRWQRVSGKIADAPTQTVLLQRSDSHSGWVTVARARTDRDGAFTARWRPDLVGRFTLRALPTGAQTSAAAASVASTRTTVYRAAIATQFGAGFYGTRTACGVVLTARTIGVAHRTLPCGTLVEFYYRGRIIRAPVIDRGPYANGADWDLTDAAAARLRFGGKDYVGSIRVGRVTLARSTRG